MAEGQSGPSRESTEEVDEPGCFDADVGSDGAAAEFYDGAECEHQRGNGSETAGGPALEHLARE